MGEADGPGTGPSAGVRAAVRYAIVSFLGLAASDLGRLMASTPSVNEAAALSKSTPEESYTERWKLPKLRSTRW